MSEDDDECRRLNAKDRGVLVAHLDRDALKELIDEGSLCYVYEGEVIGKDPVVNVEFDGPVEYVEGDDD